MRFSHVGVDAGYGKEPAFLRALDDANEVFVADVHRDQRVWTEDPGLHVPAPTSGRGRPSKKRQAAAAPVTVERLAKGLPAQDWMRCVLRDSTRGQLQVDIAHRRVWVWDGEEAQSAMLASDRPARGEIGQDDQIQPVERAGGYADASVGADAGAIATGSSALSKTPRASAAWPTIRRWAGDPGITTSRSSCWRCCSSSSSASAHQPGLELLTPRDIVEMLKETLPRKPEGKDALVAGIIERHERRRGAIASRFRTQQSRGSG